MHSATTSFPHSADFLITFSSLSLFVLFFLLTTDHSPASKSNCKKELSVLLTTVQKKPQTEEQISPPRAGLPGTAHPEPPSEVTQCSHQPHVVTEPSVSLTVQICLLSQIHWRVMNASCRYTKRKSEMFPAHSQSKQSVLVNLSLSHMCFRKCTGADYCGGSGNKSNNTQPHVGFVCARDHLHLSSWRVLVWLLTIPQIMCCDVFCSRQHPHTRTSLHVSQFFAALHLDSINLTWISE